MPKKKDEVTVHEGRQAGAVVSVRLNPEEARLLRELAKRDERTLSDTLRAALKAFAQMPTDGQDVSTGSYTRSSAVEPDSQLVPTY